VAEAVTAGATVIMASHDTDRAAAIATRTETMIGGQLRRVGDAPEITASLRVS
jgi:ABC-type proline/glycine betaine transport system ATPase subunit